MHIHHLHYLTLAVAAFAALIGLGQAKKARGGFRSRSNAAYSRAAVLFTISLAGGIILNSEKFILIGESVALLSMALGLIIQGKESEVFMKIAAEQRIDYVTGLSNGRAFYERLAAEHSRTKRTGTKYAVAVFEIDEFNSLTPADRVNGLRLLAKSLDDSVRNTDALASISDETVAVMMVDTEAEGGVVGCERARERFFFQSCGHDDAAHVTRPLTTSIGIAAFDDDTVEASDVVENALHALRRMRAEGNVGVRVYHRADYNRSIDVPAAVA